jgi:hypothetical protein
MGTKIIFLMQNKVGNGYRRKRSGWQREEVKMKMTDTYSIITSQSIALKDPSLLLLALLLLLLSEFSSLSLLPPGKKAYPLNPSPSGTMGSVPILHQQQQLGLPLSLPPLVPLSEPPPPAMATISPVPPQSV